MSQERRLHLGLAVVQIVQLKGHIAQHFFALGVQDLLLHLPGARDVRGASLDGSLDFFGPEPDLSMDFPWIFP